jgi:hypothetical protein
MSPLSPRSQLPSSPGFLPAIYVSFLPVTYTPSTFSLATGRHKVRGESRRVKGGYSKSSKSS